MCRPAHRTRGQCSEWTGRGRLSSALAKELRNFQEIAHWLMPEPGEVPRLPGIDVWDSTRALRGAVGGDHLIYVDFKQRYDLLARIAEAEARGAATVVDGLRRCGHRAASPCSTRRGTR